MVEHVTVTHQRHGHDEEPGGNAGDELALTADPTGHLVPVADALRVLQRLHRGRNYRPVADTLGRLMAETRAHVSFVLRQAGEQALANVLHVAELARQYEAVGGISFRGFIDELQQASESTATEAPILEESSDGVKVMTVHKAKGLEFPVVVLADLTCNISRDELGRYLDADRGLCALRLAGWAPHDLHEHEAEEVARDRAEGVRLAYVAATRARDVLVVPAIGDAPWEGGWLGPLNSALYPPLELRRDASPPPKCPAFASKDSVLERPDDEPARTSTVCPGLHRMPGGYDVVWWEPGPGGELALGAMASFGVRREELIVKDVANQTVADGHARYLQWTTQRSAIRQQAAVPSVVLETVHAWSADAARPAPPGVDPSSVTIVDLLDHTTREARSRGPAFGALVHALLARVPIGNAARGAAATARQADEVPAAAGHPAASRPTAEPLAAPADALEAIAAAEARILGLADEERSAAVQLVAVVLTQPLFDRVRAAASSGAVQREVAMTYTLPDGMLLEGVVDLAFEEAGRWVVVDYKTDQEIAAAGEQRYRRQVALYAAAVAHAVNRPTDAVIARI